MNENIKNIISEYKKTKAIKPQSSEELKELGSIIQKLAMLTTSYFKIETELFLKETTFISNFYEIIQKIGKKDFGDESRIMSEMKFKHYSPEDIVTLIDPELIGDHKIIAILICARLDNYIKLNTYFTTEARFI